MHLMLQPLPHPLKLIQCIYCVVAAKWGAACLEINATCFFYKSSNVTFLAMDLAHTYIAVFTTMLPFNNYLICTCVE